MSRPRASNHDAAPLKYQEPLSRSRLLDVVACRSGTVVSQWIHTQPHPWRDGVSVAAVDPFRGYATALRTSLPHAIRVLDAFHVTRLGFAAVDDVRRRVQQQSTGHRGRRDDRCSRSEGCCAADTRT